MSEKVNLSMKAHIKIQQLVFKVAPHFCPFYLFFYFNFLILFLPITYAQTNTAPSSITMVGICCLLFPLLVIYAGLPNLALSRCQILPFNCWVGMVYVM